MCAPIFCGGGGCPYALVGVCGRVRGAWKAGKGPIVPPGIDRDRAYSCRTRKSAVSRAAMETMAP